jgi:hypothetical protein
VTLSVAYNSLLYLVNLKNDTSSCFISFMCLFTYYFTALTKLSINISTTRYCLRRSSKCPLGFKPFWDVTQRWLQKFREINRFHRQETKQSFGWPLKMRPMDCPETQVTTWQTTLSNISEEYRSHLHRGRETETTQ